MLCFFFRFRRYELELKYRLRKVKLLVGIRGERYSYLLGLKGFGNKKVRILLYNYKVILKFF